MIKEAESFTLSDNFVSQEKPPLSLKIKDVGDIGKDIEDHFAKGWFLAADFYLSLSCNRQSGPGVGCSTLYVAMIYILVAKISTSLSLHLS